MGDELKSSEKPQEKADCTDDSAGGQGEPMPEMSIRELVDLYHQAVYRYAFRLVGTVPDAEDLTQQTFLKAQENLHQLRDPKKVDRWLFAVLRSCFLKLRRRRRPTSAASLDMNMNEVAIGRPESVPLDSLALQQALDELPDQHRIMIAMFYFEELSYKEIAAELSVPMGTVMSRLARAKKRLRQQMAGRPQSAGDAP